MRNAVFSELSAKKISKSGFLLFVYFGWFILISNIARAQGDLLLYPNRIVFDGSKKSQTLNLANTGKDTVRYVISVVQSRMKEDGSFEMITSPDEGQQFADKYIRFFPRSIILGPNEAQTVKIQLVNTSNLAAGEYRSHIYFRSEPDKKPLGESEPVKDSTSISVNLVAVFGITIPVIIRMGESTTKVHLSDVALALKKDSNPSLMVHFNRMGNMSVYGDISVDHISPQGKVTRVALAKGMALYTPNPVRKFNLLLDNTSGIDFHKGKLHIAYTTQPDARSIKIAETELALF